MFKIELVSKPIQPSELILNDNGSVYHLHLKPENIAKDIFLLETQIVYKKDRNTLILLNFLFKKESLKQ